MTHENRVVRVAHSGVLQGAAGGVLGAFFVILLRVADVIKHGSIVKLAPIGAAVGFAIFYGVTRALFGTSEELMKQMILPDAKGTYAPQHSHIDALEVQERYADALAAWLAVAAEQPGNPSPLLRAADLQLRRLKDPAGALALYERARRVPGARDEAVRYASQKIIDIHMGPGGDEGRALVELRRFVTMFPAGREAEGARAAIARLKRGTAD
jgi:hypothetical protein